jgi:protein JSN1
VLSPQLVPYLVHLCTHKVAYLTVLKVINQKAEPEARDTILKAMFFTPNDHVLEAILSDHACGATLIFKVLTTPFFDESIRSQVVDNVKSVLIRIKAQPGQGYKRLMDEVGLSTRNASGGGAREHSGGNNNGNSGAHEQRSRPASRQASMNGQHQQSNHMNKQFYNPLNAAPNASNFEMGFGNQRNEPVEPSLPAFPPFGGQASMFNSSNGPINQSVNLQQLQYQQSMLNRATPPINNFFPSMQAGFTGYSSPSPSIEQYRQQNMPNGSPIQPPQPGPQQLGHMGGNPQGPPFAPPGFGMGGMGGGFGYGNMGGGMHNMGYMQQEQQVNARRGRVSYTPP